MAIPNRNINYPTAIKYGAGRIRELAEFCKANGIKRPLVVTDKGLAAMPMVADIMADLKKAGLKAALFADVRPNPVEENVLAGCKAFNDGKHDGVVALGGGSNKEGYVQRSILIEIIKDEFELTIDMVVSDAKNITLTLSLL